MFQSPFHLLTDQQLQNFSLTNLKKLKNEILLNFQLSASPVIEINNRSFDKDEVIRLLDLLQTSHEAHLLIFQNKPVLHFLEDMDTSIFQKPMILNKFVAESQNYPEVHKLMAEAIDSLLPDHILDFTYQTTNLLKEVYAYTSKLDPSTQLLAYHGSYEKLKSFIDNLYVQYDKPFQFVGDFKFHPELSQIITRELLQFFRFLPQEFEHCRILYCKWCNNHIVLAFASQQELIRDWPKASLRLVIEAAVIASNFHNRDGNLQIANNLDAYLNKKGKGIPFYAILLVIIGILRIVGICNRSDHRNYNTSLPPITYEQQQQLNERVEKHLREQKMKELAGSNGNDSTLAEKNSPGKKKPSEGIVEPKLKEKKIKGKDSPPANEAVQKEVIEPVPPPIKVKPTGAGRFNGSQISMPEYQALIDFKDKGSFTEIQYDAEVFPTSVGGFTQFIPKSLATKYAQQERDFLLVFRRKNLTEVTFSHRMRISFQPSPKVLQGPVAVDSQKPLIEVRKLHLDDFHFKGFLTHLDLQGKEIRTEKLEVSVAPGGGMYNINKNGLISTSREPDDNRLKCVIKNMQIFNGMQMHASHANKVSDLLIYNFLSDEVEKNALEGGFSKVNYGPKFIYAYFLFKSAVDNTLYFAITHEQTDIKLMFDSVGFLKGIQMATVSSDQKIVERIELFRVRN